MIKQILVFTILILFLSDVTAMSVVTRINREDTCKCSAQFVRVSFETSGGILSKLKVVSSSSDNECDELLMSRLSTVSTHHPDGVTGVGVIGYSLKNKDIGYDQCLSEKELELESYWYVEDLSIELDKVNR